MNAYNEVEFKRFVHKAFKQPNYRMAVKIAATDDGENFTITGWVIANSANLKKKTLRVIIDRDYIIDEWDDGIREVSVRSILDNYTIFYN